MSKHSSRNQILQLIRRAIPPFTLLIGLAALSIAAVANAEQKTCRWSEHESRLTSYMAKIRSLEDEVSEMIEHNKHLENSEQVKTLTQQIAFKHRDLERVIKDYDAERLHVRFQHPDRDLEGERKYPSHPLKSIAELDNAFGLEGRLDKIKRQVSKVFPAESAIVQKEDRAPASVDSDDDGLSERIHLVK